MIRQTNDDLQGKKVPNREGYIYVIKYIIFDNNIQNFR